MESKYKEHDDDRFTVNSVDSENRLRSWRRRLQDPSLIPRFRREHGLADEANSSGCDYNNNNNEASWMSPLSSCLPNFVMRQTPWLVVEDNQQAETTTADETAAAAAAAAAGTTTTTPVTGSLQTNQSGDDTEAAAWNCDTFGTNTATTTTTTTTSTASPGSSSRASAALSTISPYPSTHYLQIRLLQNQNFCENCLAQGQVAIRAGNLDQAQDLYQRGLDCLPSHVELLVALGTLFLSMSSSSFSSNDSIERKQQQPQKAVEYLQRAVDLDPHHATAATHLAHAKALIATTCTAIGYQSKPTKATVARQNALWEHALLDGPTHATTVTTTSISRRPTDEANIKADTTGHNLQYNLLPESEEEKDNDGSDNRMEASSRKARRRSRHPHRHHRRDDKRRDKEENTKTKRKKSHKHRKRKRQRRSRDEHDNSSNSLSKDDHDDEDDDGKSEPNSNNNNEDSDNSSSTSETSSERRRRRRRHKRKKRRHESKRKRRSTEEEEEDSNTVSDYSKATVDSLKLITVATTKQRRSEKSGE